MERQSHRLGASEILEASPSPLVVCDDQGRVTFATAGFCDLLGQRFADVHGRPFASLAHPHDATAVAGLLSPAPETAAPRTAQIRMLDAAGALVQVEVSARPWNRPGGELLLAISIQGTSDAPSHEASAQAPDRSSTEGVASELGPSEAFFEVLNNQFRTILNHVVHGTRLLAESEVPPDLRHVANHVEASTKTLVNLVDLVVEQWMIEAGRVKPAAVDFALRSTIDNVTQTLTEIAAETGNELDIWMDQGLPNLLKGDPGRLRRIVVCLGGFVMRQVHGQVVRWRCTRVGETDRQLTVQISFVARRGPEGTKPADRATERGGRDATRERELLEWGRGPYHARCLARLMGGEAGWEVKGDGLVLWARVILEKQDERARGLGIYTCERVLVVSSVPKEAETLATALQQRGWQARGTTTQAEALDALRESLEHGEPYRLVLVTLVLPDGSAEELPRFASTIPDAAGIQVALLADVGLPGDAEWARKAGFSAYLVRPLTHEMLHDMLIEMVRHARAKAANASRIFITRHSLAESKRPPLRILVVDDDPVTRLSIGNALNRLGHEVLVATSGEEALECWDRERFDLVLMDIRLPGQDGDSIAFLFRARERTHNQPPAIIIGMSGQATPDDLQRCLASGMNDFLPKPVDFGTLTSILDSLGPGTPPPQVTLTARPEWSDPPPVEAFQEQTNAPALGKLIGIPATDGDSGETSTAASAPAESSEGAEWIDVQQLARACMGVPALGSAMLKTFAVELTNGVEELQKALVAGDRASATDRAEQLLKICRMIGADPCADALAEWMQEVQDPDASAQDGLALLKEQAAQTVAHAERLERSLPEVLSTAA